MQQDDWRADRDASCCTSKFSSIFAETDTLFLFFNIRICFIRISRLNLTKFTEYLNPRLNTIQMCSSLECMKFFFSLKGKTS